MEKIIKQNKRKIMKKNHDRKIYPGQLEIVFQSIPDHDLLMLFREEGNFNIRNDLLLLSKLINVLDEEDFASAVADRARDFKELLISLDKDEKIEKLKTFIDLIYQDYDIKKE